MIHQGTCVSVSLTHEEMGECIGATRETVSRAMADLRQRQLIDVYDSTLIIPNRFALEAYARVSQWAALSAAQARANRLSRSGIHSRTAQEEYSRTHQELLFRPKNSPPGGRVIDAIADSGKGTHTSSLE
jgi:hypothetical protein